MIMWKLAALLAAIFAHYTAAYSRDEMQSMLNHWIGTPSAQNTHPVVLQQSDEAARDYFADGTQSHLFLTITDCDQKVFSPMNDDKVFKIANFGDYEALLDRSIHEIEYPHSLQTISRAEIDSISIAETFPKVFENSQLDPRDDKDLEIMRQLLVLHRFILNMHPEKGRAIIYQLSLSLDTLHHSLFDRKKRSSVEKAVYRWATSIHDHLRSAVLPEQFLHFVCVPRPSVAAEALAFKAESSLLGVQSLAANATLPFCIKDQETCSQSTANCSSHGACTQIGKCWRCVCTQGHTGSKCEYVDYIPSFHIIFWTSIVLALIVVWFTGSLFAIDSALHPQGR